MSVPEGLPAHPDLQWVDPAEVMPGSEVWVNLMWSPHPENNLGNSWPEPPEPPKDLLFGRWDVASIMVPTPCDDHPVRWSRQARAVALLFQEVPEYLVVQLLGPDVETDPVWSIPFGLSGVVAVSDLSVLRPVPPEEQEGSVSICVAIHESGRPCSVQGPHPTHRTDFPYEWWPNDEWREPVRRNVDEGRRSLGEMARRIGNAERTGATEDDGEDVTWEEE